MEGIINRIYIPPIDTLLQKELVHRINEIDLSEELFKYTIDYSGMRKDDEDDEYMPMTPFKRAYYENIRLRKNFSGIRMDYESFNKEPKWVLWICFSGSDDVKILFDNYKNAFDVKMSILKWGTNLGTPDH